MNRNELAQVISEKACVSKKDAEKVINTLLDEITSALASGEKVQFVGFGSFETKMRAERAGLNPRTKAPITIPAARVPVFKAGKALKDAVAVK